MPQALEARTPRTEQEWRRYYALRWQILRAPWQADGPLREADDDSSIHRMLCSGEGDVLAVGRLHRIDERTGQIRFMAVAAGQQRKGYGTLLLKSLESAARAIDMDSLILQAREKAVPFYRRHGYQMVEKSFLLFGEIQHYLMRKRLGV